MSGACTDFVCSPKISELCVPESCKDDEQCESGSCIYGACAASSDEVQNGCPCRFDSHCASGECDQAITTLDWKCVEAGTGGGILDVTSGVALPSSLVGSVWVAVFVGVVAMMY